ncbi:hypothetical protein CCP3SC1AL1_420006 [Gammaproteobacteria bacterium]
MSTEQNITNTEVKPTPSPANYNPFMQQVSEKPYSNMNVGVTQDQLKGAIPEPVFTPFTIDSNENPYNMLGGDGQPSSNSGPKNNSAPFNPMMNDVSDGDKKMGAQHMAKLLVEGYEQLHVFGNKALQVPEKKIRKLEKEGLIDLSIPIPYEYGKTITAGEFLQDYNEQNKDALTVSKEFKKEVTPVLTRVLEKRGAGLTDEQYLGFLVGKDLVVKLVIVAQLRSTMNDMINVIKDYTEATRAGNGVPPQPQAPTPQPTAPQPTAPQPQYQEPSHSAPDFNFQDNEVVMNSTVQQMKVPNTGKARVIAQIEKEKKWQKDSASASEGSSYEQAMMQRKNSGKRGRKPKDYINNVKIDEDEIAESIILNESVNQPKKQKDPYLDLD